MDIPKVSHTQESKVETPKKPIKNIKAPKTPMGKIDTPKAMPNSPKVPIKFFKSPEYEAIVDGGKIQTTSTPKTPTRKAKGPINKPKAIVETPVNTRKEVLTRSGRRTRASSKEILDENEPLINSGKRTRTSGKVDS